MFLTFSGNTRKQYLFLIYIYQEITSALLVAMDLEKYSFCLDVGSQVGFFCVVCVMVRRCIDP
jgi:hypothetical protein